MCVTRNWRISKYEETTKWAQGLFQEPIEKVNNSELIRRKLLNKCCNSFFLSSVHLINELKGQINYSRSSIKLILNNFFSHSFCRSSDILLVCLLTTTTMNLTKMKIMMMMMIMTTNIEILLQLMTTIWQYHDMKKRD